MAPTRGGRGRGRGHGYMYNRTQALQAQDNNTPPEGFRELSVFPSETDLHATVPPFLRRNLIKGHYNNANHYLDVQFRLMREDFIRPLRESLAEYRGMAVERTNKRDIKTYTDVKFCKVKLSKGDLAVLIEFDPRQVPNPDNAFKTGSLLCLSMNNFENIIIATVGESYPKGVEGGHILIKLHNEKDLLETIYDNKYTMLEPDSFFDPYNHVMAALQSMALQMYPMCDYVIGSKRMTQAPAYLSSYSSTSVYDINDRQVSLFDDSSWPSAKELGLNPNQFQAFKMALCSNMALIQGPPGTGKTFLGLKVAQTLIENLEDNAPPILVVCATNHALDQFLEHLTTITNDLVRCGAQSQSTILQNYLLSKRRREYRALNRNVEAIVFKSEKKMRSITKDVQRYLDDIEKIVKHQGVISLESLSAITNSSTLAHFGKDQLENHELLAWLEDRGPNEASDPGLTENNSDMAVSFVIDLKVIDNILKNNARQIEVLSQQLVEKKHGGASAAVAANLIETLKERSEELVDHRDILEEYLNKDIDEISSQTAALYKNGSAWKLPKAKRWQLYHHWASAALTELKSNMFVQIKRLKNESSLYKACKMEQDLIILKDAKIVGMTTSCSARLRPLLDNLQPRIMIVEEAAEVLEGHIVASLTKHCQHLILIGDHQQLRPITSSHELTRDYKLDVSLFERLVNNELPCVALQVQHRMRPEIAMLITPAIYPQLTNHHTVMERENVLGIDKNVFFVTHKQPEELASGMSRKNEHEADFLLALCRYLLQDYTHDKITIIATYAAQVSLIESKREMCDDENLKQVRVSSVDGYQGEENDIILLSLVRSNQQGDVGFLRTPNRVCVALSRARIGLYVVGNMECLTLDPRSTWCAINNVLKKQNSIGTYLTLCCKSHRKHARVSCADDFHFDRVARNNCPLECDDGQRVMKPMQNIEIITREFFNSRVVKNDGKNLVQPANDEKDKENMLLLVEALQVDDNLSKLVAALNEKKAAMSSQLPGETVYNDIETAKKNMRSSLEPLQVDNNLSKLIAALDEKRAAMRSQFPGQILHGNFESSKPTMPVSPFTTPKTASVSPFLKHDAIKKVSISVQPTKGNRVNNRTAYQHIFSPDYGLAPQSCAETSHVDQACNDSSQSKSKPWEIGAANTVTARKPTTSRDLSAWTEPEADWDGLGKYSGPSQPQVGNYQYKSIDTRATASTDMAYWTPGPTSSQGAIPKSSSTSYSYSFVKQPVKINQQVPARPLVSVAPVVLGEVPRVTPRVRVTQEAPRETLMVKVPQQDPHLTPRVRLSRDIPCAISTRPISQAVPFVTPRVVLQETRHVTTRMVSQEISRVSSEVSQETSIEYARDAAQVLGVHTRQTQQAGTAGKKKKCVIQ